MTSLRVLLLGASGQVGSAVAAALAPVAQVLAPGRGDADLTRPETLHAAVRAASPDVVINAAAYTAVDRAEREPEQAFAVNAVGPGALAAAAAAAGARLVHYSTDYVFDGRASVPYDEAATTAPLQAYGRSKLAGERLVLAAAPSSVVLRTGWVYGPVGTNFLLTMRRLMREHEEVRVVSDQFGTPTPTSLLANATRRVMEVPTAPGGVYHIAASGVTTWFGFASAIHERLRARESLRCLRVVPITAAEYGAPARRPAWAVLRCDRFAATFGISAEPWERLLDAAVAALPP